MLGAARAWRSDGVAALRLSAGRLVVCPTPIGNLEDVTLRVLSALREADVVACEDTRRTRVLLDRYGVQARRCQLPRAQRARARRPSSCERMRGGRGRGAGQRRRDAARERPGLRARAGVRGGRARGRGAARAVSAALAALVASGLPARDVALRRVPAAQEGRARGGVRRAGDARGVRVAAAAWRRRWRCSRRSTRERPVAVCRELTKVHEEVVRGTRRRARRSATRTREPRGEIVLVVGGRRRRASGDLGAGARRRCGGWSTRAPGRGRRRRSWPSLTGASRQRAVPRADAASAALRARRSHARVRSRGAVAARSVRRVSRAARRRHRVVARRAPALAAACRGGGAGAMPVAAARRARRSRYDPRAPYARRRSRRGRRPAPPRRATTRARRAAGASRSPGRVPRLRAGA